ncbi:BlaI/MecI/CopY family transcriptional regulator [Streptomyces sp. NPDC006984]|uniref:BlaI/MecI/CopY family transcriptional regulator n=1 Tax=Streptomyces sp. NPDC006984 TaxID=3155463 RepID=UPI0033D7C8C8
MKRDLGELEAVVMDLIWGAGVPLTVRETREALCAGGRSPAYTTVSTVLDNLRRKDFLAVQADGRAYRYSPLLSRAEYGADLALHGLDVGGEECFAALLPRLTPAQRGALEAALSSEAPARGRTEAP